MTFFTKIIDLLHSARNIAVHAENQTMVISYFEIGRMIVSKEKNGKERAEYGKRILKELSLKLTNDFERDFRIGI